jgi:hypothetical protein
MSIPTECVPIAGRPGCRFPRQPKESYGPGDPPGSLASLSEKPLIILIHGATIFDLPDAAIGPASTIPSTGLTPRRNFGTAGSGPASL